MTRGRKSGCKAWIICGLFLAAQVLLEGCNNGGGATTPVAPANPAVNTYGSLNNYTLPNVSGVSFDLAEMVFTIDHSQNTFTLSQVGGGFNQGASLASTSAGSFSSISSGFLTPQLSLYGGTLLTPSTSPQSMEIGNWVLEIPGELGFAYVSAPNFPSQIQGMTSGPQGQGDTSQNLFTLVSNAACPNLAVKQTYLFLTYPAPFVFPNPNSSGFVSGTAGWNTQTDTAYGTVDIATVQDIVNFSNINQFLLPVPAGFFNANPPSPPAPILPGTAIPLTLSSGGNNSAAGPIASSGACSNGFEGHITVVPPLSTNPANVFLTPSGLLLEEPNPALGGTGIWSPLLGSGYGAIGLAKPASPVNESTFVGAKYNGFAYEPTASSTLAFTTTVSFGVASASSSACSGFVASLAAASPPLQPSANTIYGGEFLGNDPGTNATSNCDLAIDLGTQDSQNNGVFPNATIYVGGATGSAYPLNVTGSPYTLPAVAIAGQLNGKNVIFLLGIDLTSQNSVGIYLIQAGS